MSRISRYDAFPEEQITDNIIFNEVLEFLNDNLDGDRWIAESFNKHIFLIHKYMNCRKAVEIRMITGKDYTKPDSDLTQHGTTIYIDQPYDIHSSVFIPFGISVNDRRYLYNNFVVSCISNWNKYEARSRIRIQ